MENYVEKTWVCYILRSINPKYLGRTYVGSTNNIKRRIRQHNREIVGGAKMTGIIKPCEIICIISGFPNKIAALRCEWLLKHPSGSSKNNKCFYGVNGRIKGLNHLIVNSQKWHDRANTSNIDIWILSDLLHNLDIDHLGTDVQVYSC